MSGEGPAGGGDERGENARATSDSNGGLVKNLLFPTYTDAGSNEAFKSTPENDIVQSPDRAVEESMLTHTGAGLDRSLNAANAAAADTSGSADESTMSTSNNIGSPTPMSPLVPPTPEPRRSPRDKGSSAPNVSAEVAKASTSDEPSSGKAPKSPPKMLRKTAPRPLLPPSSAADHDRASVSMLSTATTGVASSASGGTGTSLGGTSSVLGTKFLDGHEVSSTVSTNVIGNLSTSNITATGSKSGNILHEVSSTVSTNVIDNLSADLSDGAASMEATPAAVASTTGTGVENGVLHLSAENLARISPSKASKRQVNKDDDSDEVNSMTSHMGSEPGERKLRLGEVVQMEAVAESEGDEDEDEDADDRKRKGVLYREHGRTADLSMPALSQHEIQLQQQQRSISTSASVGVPDTTGSRSTSSTAAEDDVPAPSPIKTLSAAIHRIGTGVQHSMSGRATPNEGLAAGSGHGPSRASPSWTPKTPRSSHPSPRAEQPHYQQIGSSISSLLRSPRLTGGGETGTANAILSPRFSSLSPYRKTSPGSQSVSHKGATAQQNILASPFNRARGCMSFDESTAGSVSGGSPPQSPLMNGRSRKVHLQQRNSRSSKQSAKHRSQSWDSETAHRYVDGATMLHSRYDSDPVRQEPASSPRRRRHPKSPRQLTGISSASAGDAFRSPGPAAYVRGGGVRGERGSDGRYGEQHSGGNVAPRAAAVAERIEIERDDAINILSCLVETSIAFREKDGQDSGNSSSDQLEEANILNSDEGVSTEDMPKPKHNRTSSLSEVNEAMKSIRLISQEYENRESSDETHDKDKDADNDVIDTALRSTHDVRMGIIDELLKSHTYAVEMQRAALSASTWLKAIGRSDDSISGKSNTNSNRQISYSYSDSSTGAAPGKVEDKTQDGKDEVKSVSDENDTTKMEVVTLAARLNVAEARAAEKNEYAKRLDEELAKCRAEIGRLKSSSRSEAVFSSPNKSIFDVEEEDESSTASSEASDISPQALERALKDISAVVDDDDAQAARDGVRAGINAFLTSPPPPNTTTKPGVSIEVEQAKEIILLKAALEEANTKLNDNVKEETASISTDDAAGRQAQCKMGVAEPVEAPHAKDGTFDVEMAKVEGEKPDEDNENPKPNDVANEEPTGTASADKSLPPSLSSPILEKDLESFRDSIRKADSEEIAALKQELDKLKRKVAAQSPMKQRPKSSPGNKEERMINVRMLDGENFVTEWGELSPLPPPPEHVLRSPIVYELLSQWTSDQKMQESLLGWVERIIRGDDPAVVPPLKISALDHRLRDGFTMHIIPLLLRRPDIHVEVTTRAHRRTSYDIAVSVTQLVSDRDGTVSFGRRGQDNGVPKRTPNKQLMMAFKASSAGMTDVDDEDDIEEAPGLQQKVRNTVSEYLRGNSNNLSAETGTGSVANASDVTSRISNIASIGNKQQQQSRFDLTPRPGPGHDSPLLSGPPSADEYSVGSSLTGGSSSHRSGQPQNPEQQQAGLVGRAFGLLSRSKDDTHDQKGDPPPRDIRGALNPHDIPPSGSRLQMPSLAEEGGQGSMYATEEEEEQFHRVVSVPPGKIGITFVQYRGHAMVSDVSPESPLSGWVFPSDIVIAVDEKAVSGLRVREIVDLLKARKDRQRALRVISSHDLTEIVSQEAPSALLG